MPDPVETFRDAVGRLRSLGIDHILIGAVALAARGVARATDDVDLLVVDAAALRRDAWEGLPGAVDVRRGDGGDPLDGVVHLGSIDEDGDLCASVQVIVLDRRWTRAMVARALAGGPIPVRGEQICVPDAADLVLLKLYAGGPNDLRDVNLLLQTPGAEAIRRDVDERITGLPDRFRTLWLSVRSG